MSPVALHERERVGLELEKVVPFEYWEDLKYSIDHGKIGGSWIGIYNYTDERRFYTGRSTREIQEDVMGKIDTIQTEAFGALHRDDTTILSLHLYTFDHFEIPQHMLVGAITRDTVMRNSILRRLNNI
jgi:hypothetical protein